MSRAYMKQELFYTLYMRVVEKHGNNNLYKMA